MKDPDLHGKVGFKIEEHLNGTAAAKPFSYDILRRISFSSISIQYVLYFTSRVYEVGLEAKEKKLGGNMRNALNILRLLHWLRWLECTLVCVRSTLPTQCHLQRRKPSTERGRGC